ncbi:uncharacterized protein PITG_22198 [Phytophthora infestans T30-4]|uniref:Magnesium-dependent phosphatase-1 n=1 Tax=Phytophthora infestans (strain T30-4) TaxID=403677 RepID=D0RLZ1_PHYIT|nr:uncharacterized protein PITG_22198 [Phytophthora infestans T30-4]EEY55867.1 conserved hypothetical protein [Phytophthora infestans T30-4]|eukprot:XP_002909939.1 conserved hypothetical protein [Phytophthora infestans T30-4]
MPRAKAKITLKAKRAKSKTSGSSSRPHAAFRKWDHIPRLVVFDLDFTLWFPEMYELWGAPGKQCHFFGAVHTVIYNLETDPQFRDTTETCMRLMDTSLQSIVDYEAIYPRNKRVHFEQLKKDSGIPYEEMLFFDNEYGNVHDIQKIGVTCAYCPQGLTEGSWIQGMEAFQAAKTKETN